MTEGHVIVSLRWLEEEVQRTNRGISTKFVCKLTIEEVYNDVLVGLKLYNNAVRSKSRQIELLKGAANLLDPEDQTNPDDIGLDTGGNGPNKPNNQPSKQVEAHLYGVQKELIDHLKQLKECGDSRNSNPTEKKVNSLLKNLKEQKDVVTVPINKTNSTILMATSKYAAMCIQHL